jgi:hypothetical protein
MAFGTETLRATNTEKTRLPEWARLLNMYWPRTSWTNESDIPLAIREINNRLERDQPTDHELCKVVEFMAGPESQQKYSPSLREFVINIYQYRKHERGDVSANTAASYSRIIDDVKHAMRQASDFKTRWNIMCQPTLYAGLERDTNQDELSVLNAWACEVWHDWEDQAHKIKCRFAAEMRAARLAMANERGTVRVTDSLSDVPF